MKQICIYRVRYCKLFQYYANNSVLKSLYLKNVHVKNKLEGILHIYYVI